MRMVRRPERKVDWASMAGGGMGVVERDGGGMGVTEREETPSSGLGSLFSVDDKEDEDGQRRGRLEEG